MKYIDRINSFWDYATMNPLSTGQVSLYLALMHICNRSYWTEWFQASNQVLSVLTGLSKSGIQKARNELKQRNLIDFKDRGTKATMYTILDSGRDSSRNSGRDSGRDNGQDIYINIHNKDERQKTEDKEQPPISPVEHFPDFWSSYPNHQRRTLTEKAYCDLVLSRATTEEELVKAAQNYAEYIQITGEKMYLPNNFLEKRIFEDFLPGKYQKPNTVQVQHLFCDNHLPDTIQNVSMVQKNRIDELVKEQAVYAQNENVPEVRY